MNLIFIFILSFKLSKSTENDSMTSDVDHQRYIEKLRLEFKPFNFENEESENEETSSDNSSENKYSDQNAVAYSSDTLIENNDNFEVDNDDEDQDEEEENEDSEVNSDEEISMETDNEFYGYIYPLPNINHLLMYTKVYSYKKNVLIIDRLIFKYNKDAKIAIDGLKEFNKNLKKLICNVKDGKPLTITQKELTIEDDTVCIKYEIYLKRLKNLERILQKSQPEISTWVSKENIEAISNYLEKLVIKCSKLRTRWDMLIFEQI